MLELYWVLFIVGIILAVLTIVFGELIGGLVDGVFDIISVEGPDFMHPMTVVGGLTILGGAGILLTNYTSWEATYVLVVALVITLVSSILLYFVYIRPMRHAESSTGYSIQDLIGKVAEVSVSVPAVGFGEVIVRSGAGNANEIAASFDKIEIERGAQVVIIDVKDGIVFVSPFDLGQTKS